MSRLILVVACVLPLTVAHTGAETSASSPRGKIVYASMWGPNVHNPEIYSIQADGSQRRNLTMNQAYDADFALSRAGDQVAFVSYRRSSSSELFLVRVDGSELRGLTPPGLRALTSPTWSPDGRRLAFAGFSQDANSHGIWVVDADGTNLRQVTRDGRNPVWAPTGNRVAFTGDANQVSTLDVVDVDTGARIRLVNDSVIWAPSWSPDGQELAVVRFAHALYKVDADGGTPELLVSDEAREIKSPAWSPTGAKIAFGSGETSIKTVAANGGAVETVSEGDRPVWSPDGRQIASAGESKVFVGNADGTGRRVVRSEPRARITFGPAWSPDGHTLLYASMITDNDRELYSVNADGSQRKQLTKNRVDDVQPAWSPGHKRVAFVREVRDGLAVWVMTATGRRQRPLRIGIRPSWSPDGKRLAFESGGDIYTMNDRGKALRRITRGQRPVWAPRGRKIAFLRGTKLLVVDAKTKTVRMPDALPRCDYVGEGGRPPAIPSTPEWSPGAKRLVVSVYCDYDRWAYTKVWIVDIRDGLDGELPIDISPGERLAWSPDGTRLAFSLGSDPYPSFGYRTIHTAALDGSGGTTVTTGAGDDIDADW